MSDRPPAGPSSDDRRAGSREGRRRPILWGDLLLGVAVLVLGGWFLVGSFEIRLLSGYSRIGPRFFPYLVAGGLLLCAVLLIVQALRGQAAPLEMAEDVDVMADADWRAIGLLVVSLFVYILLIERLGFVLASTLLFWGVAFAFGSRHWLRDPLAGLILAVAVYLGFTQLLDLTLPAGILPLAALAAGG